ncbi:MAG: flagellar hook-associated protein FlgK [Bacteriovorax sp.]
MADLLGIGKSGLFASKKSLEVTGHNLSNVNTEGYSRQKVMQSTAIPIGTGGFIQGTGVKVDGITRVNDEFIDKRLNSSLSASRFHDARSEHLDQIESIFNEVDNEGLNQILNKFFNSFRELANQPENETIRSVVRDNANLVVKDFHRIRDTLDSQAQNIDRKITSSVSEVNQILSHIADLNVKIATVEAQQGETGDLRDQRDLAVKNLSEHFKIHTYTDEKNRFVITAQGIGTLVTGLHSQELAVISKNKESSSNNMNGSVEVVLKDRPSQSVTNSFQSGSLSAIIKVRNVDLRKLQDNIDEIAYQFTTSVNSIHRQGFVNRPLSIGPEGTPAAMDAKGPTTGLDFFAQPLEKDGASSSIDLAESVKSDLSNIAAALAPNAPGDNRVAIAISKLQHERIAGEDSVTLEEKYLQTIGSIGLETGKARLDAEQANGILAQTNSIRERLAGVSIDEETANMVRYQHAYEASAKVMQAADEMFKTVLELKR